MFTDFVTLEFIWSGRRNIPDSWITNNTKLERIIETFAKYASPTDDEKTDEKKNLD